MEVSLQIINLQTELNYLDSANIFKIFSVLTWPHPSSHPPIHPPTNFTHTHGWGSLHRFQIFKQNWNISITSSATEFWLILAVPPWGVGGGKWVPPHTCTHTCMHACMHAYDIIGNSQGFPKNPMEAAICMKLSCLPCVHVRVGTCRHVHACACMCMHVHMCGGTPQPPPTHIHPTPTPRDTGSPKHQNSISLELIEIIQFCLKILYLWTFLNSYRL